jgi:hypothetical protein
LRRAGVNLTRRLSLLPPSEKPVQCHESFNIGPQDAPQLEAWSLWWTALCAAAALNVVLWAYSARALKDKGFSEEIYATRRRLLWLAGIYTLGCAFRSGLPMVDVPRICLHDTWVSRIFVGRLVATAAELAFALQWVILLREAGAPLAARLVTPLLVAAEGFSWVAVLTRNNLHHAIENSLWTLSAVVAAAGIASLWPHAGGRRRGFIAAAVACAAAYVAFMVSYDVPMYLGRWHAGIPVGRDYLGFGAGLEQILERCTVERDWARWRQDAVWLTLYFTTAVWMSISLANVPSLKADASRAARRG